MIPKTIINNDKGMILLMVLSTILIVVALANVILTLITSQSRLTHHQVSRIQAYYAAQAGMNYALERLRNGSWTFSPNSCLGPADCIISDNNFPPAIREVRIIFCPAGSVCAPVTTICSPPAGLNFCINTTAIYTYTP